MIQKIKHEKTFNSSNPCIDVSFLWRGAQTACLLQKATTYRLRDRGKYEPVDIYFFDYRNTDEGYLFSYRRSKSGAQYLFDKVTANAVMPQSLFLPN